MKILLDYFFPITATTPTPPASTAFLKQVLIVVKPKALVSTGVITQCTTMAQVLALTDNEDAEQLFAAGMSRVKVLPMDDLDLADALEGHESEFFTLLISSDFSAAEFIPSQAQGVFTVSSYANLVSGTADTVSVAGVAFTAQSGAATPGTPTFQAASSNNATATSLAAQINAHATTSALVIAEAAGAVVTVKAKNAGSAGNDIAAAYADNDTNVGGAWTGLSGGKLAGGDGFFPGAFTGVVGVSSDDDGFLEDQAVIKNRVAFHADPAKIAQNMFFSFGTMLADLLDWKNQQYIAMPQGDDVSTLGEANDYFDKKISFVINDDEFGPRLSLFAAGGKAIVAPYITKNLEVDMQSAGLRFISGNQPNYTFKAAALLEDELQKVINLYIDRGWIESGSVSIKLEQQNFVASGYINISEPKAMWRIFGSITES